SSRGVEARGSSGEGGMNSERKLVGRISYLARYPVKGMAGESVTEARLGWQGFDHDRSYAFYEIGSRSGLPWLSARRYPKLVTYSAILADEEDPPVVSSPDGTVYSFWSDELREVLTAATRRPLTPVRLYRRAYDAQPLSLITAQRVRIIS